MESPVECSVVYSRAANAIRGATEEEFSLENKNEKRELYVFCFKKLAGFVLTGKGNIMFERNLFPLIRNTIWATSRQRTYPSQLTHYSH
jgi:hypothetical protein